MHTTVLAPGSCSSVYLFNVDVLQPWPRTATERMLVSMCQGSAAQALGLLEALTDTNRRTLLSAPPVPPDVSDTELLDVYSELFSAAQEIISGWFSSLQLHSYVIYLRQKFCSTVVVVVVFVIVHLICSNK